MTPFVTRRSEVLAALRRKVVVSEAMPLRIGELRRNVRLGSEAVYRICGWDEELVVVEVVNAPGLEAGQRFRFARQAVTQMAVIDAGGSDAADRG